LIKKKKLTYLERKSFFHGGEFPIHSGSLLKDNCLAPLVFSLTPSANYPHTERLFLHTKTTLTSPNLLSGTETIMFFHSNEALCNGAKI
jgi:hypothetical protein